MHNCTVYGMGTDGITLDGANSAIIDSEVCLVSSSLKLKLGHPDFEALCVVSSSQIEQRNLMFFPGTSGKYSLFSFCISG